MTSLATRIGLSYLTLTALTLAIGGFAVFQFGELSGALRLLLRENYRSVVAVDNMAKELARQQVALGMRTADPARARASFEASEGAFLTWYARAATGALPEPRLLDSLRASYEVYRTSAARLLDGNATSAEATTLEAAADRVRQLSFQLSESNQDALRATHDRVLGASRVAQVLVIAAALLATLVGIVGGFRFARGVTRPLQHLTESVARVRRGHLGEQVPVTTNDEVGALAAAFNQMTARLEAYEALNVQALMTEKQKAESLVEATPSPLVVTDAGGRVVLLNRAAQHLLGPDAGREPSLAELAPTLARHLEAAEGETDTVDLSLDDQARTYRPRQTVVEGLEGGVALRIILLDDVTPFKALDRARRDFVATVSHELRTPLTSLGVALDLLRRDLAGQLTPEQYDLLHLAKGDQERLKRLVGGLITQARLEAGMAAPRRTAVDAAAAVAAALDGLRLQAQQKGVEIEADLRPGLQLDGDPEQLGWVVTNLVANALRHTPRGGHVTVRTRREADVLRLVVEDTGPGVPAEAAERIFEPFVQLGDDEERVGSAGLGLAIARRAVEGHGGRLWAEPGPGGRFVVTLPLASAPSPPDASHGA